MNEFANLSIACDSNGRSETRVNLTCHSTEDIDDVVAWLELAKTVMIKWEEIRRDEQTAKGREHPGRHRSQQAG